MLVDLVGALPIHRKSGRRSYILIAYPLVWRRRMLAPFEAATLVRVVDPTRRDRADATLLREAFRLSPREAELAVLLRGGHSVESAAATCGLTVGTARLHLNHVFQKTGTVRQADLLRLLAKVASAVAGGERTLYHSTYGDRCAIGGIVSPGIEERW